MTDRLCAWVRSWSPNERAFGVFVVTVWLVLICGSLPLVL